MTVTVRLLRGLVAILVLAASARLDLPVPGSPVPQSAQTAAVLLVGWTLGARDAGLTMLGYLVLGGLGLPVFADGASGWSHLVGPTAGFLLGFLVAAVLVGQFAATGLVARFGPVLGVMLAGHVVILGLGWTRLGITLGAGAGYAQGVAPFLLGGVVKSVLCALLVTGGWSRYFGLARQPPQAARKPLAEE